MNDRRAGHLALGGLVAMALGAAGYMAYVGLRSESPDEVTKDNFEQWDRNHDGSIDMRLPITNRSSELLGWHRQTSSNLTFIAPSHYLERTRMFEAIDAAGNSDRIATTEESNKWAIDNYDADRDGTLSWTERRKLNADFPTSEPAWPTEGEHA